MCVCVCVKWDYFCRKVSVNARNYFCWKVWVWMQESWKVGVIFLSLAIHVSTPIFHISYMILAAPKVLSLSHLLGCTRQKVQPSFSSPFSLFLFSSLFALRRQPSLSHQNKVSLSKEEIKGLTLKFQLPSLWVSNQNFIWLFLFLYPLSWFYRLNYDSVLVIWRFDDIMVYWMFNNRF